MKQNLNVQCRPYSTIWNKNPLIDTDTKLIKRKKSSLIDLLYKLWKGEEKPKLLKATPTMKMRIIEDPSSPGRTMLEASPICFVDQKRITVKAKPVEPPIDPRRIKQVIKTKKVSNEQGTWTSITMPYYYNEISVRYNSDGEPFYKIKRRSINAGKRLQGTNNQDIVFSIQKRQKIPEMPKKRK